MMYRTSSSRMRSRALVVAVLNLELGEHLFSDSGADADVGVEVEIVDRIQTGEDFKVVEHRHVLVELLGQVVRASDGHAFLAAVIPIGAVEPGDAGFGVEREIGGVVEPLVSDTGAGREAKAQIRDQVAFYPRINIAVELFGEEVVVFAFDKPVVFGAVLFRAAAHGFWRA